MMENIQDLQYPYGNSERSADQNENKMKKMQSLLKEAKFEEVGSQICQSYGMRENLKKTLRAVDQNFHLPQDRVCNHCGKVFQSMKALCGHMAFHSERKLTMDTEFEERKTRTKEKGKRYNRFIAKSSSYTLANASSSISETDEKEIAICLMMLSRNYASCRDGVNTILESSDNHSLVLETESRSNEMRNTNKEINKCVFDGEDVLDMDKTGDKKLNYSNSLDAEMVQQDNSDSGYFLDDVSISETEKGVKIQSSGTELRKEINQENGTKNCRISIKTWKNDSMKRTRELLGYDDELVVESYKRIKYGSAYAEVLNTQHKRSKYECLNCKKIFKSFQALGGHRPCHKRNNVDDAADQETILESKVCIDTKKGISKEVKTSKAVKKVRSKKQKGHACPYCQRVFKSGQALGGHKRSHFLGGNAVITKPVVHDLFDLNLPAPQEEDDNNV